MQSVIVQQSVRAHSHICRKCISFRQTTPRRIRSRCNSARKRTAARASNQEATEEDVQQVQESSNAGRKLDVNAAHLLTWDEIGDRAGSSELQGYQLLDQSPNVGQPRTAPTRVLPAEESTTTDRPVLLYRDTNAWCPFCERVRPQNCQLPLISCSSLHLKGNQRCAHDRCGLRWKRRTYHMTQC